MKTRKYRPSNGTEGIAFDNAWCASCERDRAWREDETKGEPCEILSRTFVHNIDDLEYPTEWVEDDVSYPQPTNPRCTAFVPYQEDAELYWAAHDERQGDLPL